MVMTKNPNSAKTTGIIALNKPIGKNIETVKYQLILTFLSVCGIFCGVMLLKIIGKDMLSIVFNVLTEFTSVAAAKSFVELFSVSMCINLIYLFVCMFGGLCIVGQPFIASAIVFKSMSVGFISANLYAEHAIDGLEYCVLLIFPSALLMIIALIIGGTESLHTVKDINSDLFKNNTEKPLDIRIYALRYFVPFVLCAVSSLVHALTTKMFSDLFNFI